LAVIILCSEGRIEAEGDGSLIAACAVFLLAVNTRPPRLPSAIAGTLESFFVNFLYHVLIHLEDHFVYT
jgi:hypothetical protein